MRDELTIYKASAGSGKTFRLALEYIKLLTLNPTAFRSTLAVTFTNKATDEMKTRILAMLYAFANSLPDGKACSQVAASELGISHEQIHKCAAIALQELIHNYDYFHVETIDSFFQTVLRNLAKELDLGAALRIELDGKRIESEAVDCMVDELDESSRLFRWLMTNILEKIENGENWNVIKDAKNFGNMIFDDEYQRHAVELDAIFAEKDFFSHYRQDIVDMRKRVMEQLEGQVGRFNDILSNYGIDAGDLYGGTSRGILAYMNGLLNNGMKSIEYQKKTVDGLLTDAKKWYKQKTPSADRIAAVADDVLIPFLQETENMRRRAIIVANSAIMTLRNLDNLRLLGDIGRKMKEMNANENRFLLSDTQQVLAGMIDDSDSPFIFEKIGMQLQHIMIDEFQDTSLVQWRNFFCLLRDCMSSKCADEGAVANLIVGDIKQSIYRWRGGDWRLLAGIRDEFPGYSVDVQALKDNYRSERNIVLFNNAFFRIGVEMEADAEAQVNALDAHLLTEAYADVEQQPMKKDPKGLVSICLLNSENWQQRMLEETEKTLRMLIAGGTPPRNIAILLRTNRSIGMLADYLHVHCPDISVLSDEAFRLEYAVSTRCIILALKHLYEPSDILSLGLLAKINLELLGEDNADARLASVSELSELLPEEYVSQADKLRKLPLYDLCERLSAIFGLDKLTQESAYMCAFFDALTAYVNDMTASPLGFVNEWEENISRKTIQTDSVDGVRLLTISKSKGLEFDTVILPYCNWQLEKYSGNIIWCHPAEEPFSRLPAIPIDYSTKLRETVYAADFRHEHTQNTIDNMNLLYVAFTRPKKNLFVIGQRPSSRRLTNNRSQLLADVLPALCGDASLEGAQLEGEDDQEGDLLFTYGTFEPSVTKEQDETLNVFLKPYAPLETTFPSRNKPMNYLMPYAEGQTEKHGIDFKQSNSSRQFIEELSADESGEETSSQKALQYIKEGNVMHLVLSEIRTVADIPGVLERYESEGILPGANLDRATIERNLNAAINGNPTVAEWFSPRWTLFNECSILCETSQGEVTTLRPDRVMKDGERIVVVDFKFGRADMPKYREQVKTYISLLKEMGYTDVTGYLWFLKQGKVINVDK